MKKATVYKKILSLKKAIEALKSDTMPPEEKNKLLKAIVKQIIIETWGTNKRNDVHCNLIITLRL